MCMGSRLSMKTIRKQMKQCRLKKYCVCCESTVRVESKDDEVSERHIESR